MNETRHDANPAPSKSSDPLASYKFSSDEMRVMKECNRESFFQRSLPLGTAFGLGAFYAIQKGYFTPSARFGAFPKVSIGVIVGYFVGKLSYQQKCAEKLMALPGSYIGQILRERQKGSVFKEPSNEVFPSLLDTESSNSQSTMQPSTSLNLYSDRPTFSFDEESYKSGDIVVSNDISIGEHDKSKLSYDELRNKNRNSYNEHRQSPYSVNPADRPVVTRVRQPTPKTNQYGDSVE